MGAANTKDLFNRFVKVFPKEAPYEAAWTEITKAYTASGRYYHNLNHLSNMFFGLDNYPNQIAQYTCLALTIFYHDIIYNPLRKDNERRSAELAKTRLLNAGLAPAEVQIIYNYILATQHHLNPSHDADLSLLLDLDLAILGAPRDQYAEYAQQIRREYWMYPRPFYRQGRKKALQHFLQRKRIFQTAHFSSLEARVKENLAWEMQETS
ncbi:MAG: hypothetical protein AAFQ37_05575 [Bacteroidota bacterium]